MFVRRTAFGFIRLRDTYAASLAQAVPYAPLIALRAIMIAITFIVNYF
jgi:hypothetical protein